MTKKLQAIIEDSLDDLKAKDVNVIDVVGLSDVMDTMVIATGTSNRHVKSLASSVIEDAKASSIRPIGVEGMDAGEWVLVDYGDTVVHVMLAATREFYELEKLWSTKPESREE
jgi:ribosome-associated protein